MDFLVVGLGLGALAILSGITMMTFVVWRSQRTARRATRPEDQRYHEAAAGSQHAAGQALVASGAAILLATVGAVAGSLDDRTGSLLVATTATVAALGLIVRDFLYRSRYPLPRRPRVRPVETPVAAAPIRTVPIAAAPLASSPRPEQDEEPGPGEVVAAFVEEPARAGEEGRDSSVVQEAPAIDASLDALPEMDEAGPEPETDALIDVPYSFMQDDDPASQVRVVPYSFMSADDLEDEAGETGATAGAEMGTGHSAPIVAAEPPNDADTHDRDQPRKMRPALRLVGKERSQTP